MDIENLNQDLDENGEDGNINYINLNNYDNTNKNNLYHDRTKSNIPKKEPRPMKPY